MTRESFNHFAAANAARGYDAIADDLLEGLTHTVNTQTLHSLPSHHTVGLVSSIAVLHALATEVMLKAIAGKVGQCPKKTHNHRVLFAALPDAIQAACRARYQTFLDLLPAAPQTDQASLITDLAELLARSANVFVEWRYLYESHPGSAGYLRETVVLHK
jgi:hypothetical protein